MCSKCCNTYLLVEKENKPHMSEHEAAEDRARTATAENSPKCVEAKMLLSLSEFSWGEKDIVCVRVQEFSASPGQADTWQTS